MSVFLFESAFSPAMVQDLFRGNLAFASDRIEFRDATGGEASRELAIRYLPGMDEVQVSQAELRIRARTLEVETQDYTTAAGQGGGVVLRLARPGLLKKVVLGYTAPTLQPPATVRLVVRLAEQGSSVPIFANPGMPSLGAMYGPALPSFRLSQVSNGHLAELPSVMGSAWLFQLATGDTPQDLTPLNVPIGIISVVLDAVPQDLSLTLASAEDVVLWSNPGLLLPASGEQIVSFAPLAQRHLTEKLKAATDDTAALSASLRFHSSSAGALDIVYKSLRAVYVSRPFGTEPKTIRLPGDRTDLSFPVPSGVTPQQNSFRLTLKPKGMVRDADSPESPIAGPVQGLMANQNIHAAARLPIASGVPVTRVRVRLQANEATEAVIEARADVAGSPGEVFGKPAVRQFTPGPAAWFDFAFPEPLAPPTPFLWLALRTNQGGVLWFTDTMGGATPKLSFDHGRTWGVPDTPLGPAQNLLAQLFLPDDPDTTPTVQLREGANVHVANLMANAQGGSADTSIPTHLLAAPPASGKTVKHFALASTANADAVIENFVITYDPEL
jgi:hypothetical protein